MNLFTNMLLFCIIFGLRAYRNFIYECLLRYSLLYLYSLIHKIESSAGSTMMTIIIQIFGDFLCLESDFERLAFCIKTICTSKSPKWIGDSYEPKKFFGFNGKLIRKSIFIKKILAFLQKFKFQKQQSVATTEYSCLLHLNTLELQLHHDCLVNIIREN